VAAGRSAQDYSLGDNPWLGRPLGRDDLTVAIAHAASYLERNQLPDGQFVYLKDPLGRCCTGRPDRYSLIRHLGAVFALERAYQTTRTDAYLTAARRGLDFVTRFVTRSGDTGAVHGLTGQISLGENGFLLIDLVLLDQLTQGRSPRPLENELAAFLMKALRYGGPYATKEQWAECQAAIGLLRYYEHVRHDPHIVQVVHTWLRGALADDKATHWSVQAVYWLNHAAPGLDHELTDWALHSARQLLADVPDSSYTERPRLVGGRGGALRSCNAAARNEALIDAHRLALALGHRADAAFFWARAREHIAYVLQFQYGQNGNLYGHNPLMQRLARLFDLDGGVFNDPAKGTVRIDFVSHHIRAITAYMESPFFIATPPLALSMADLVSAPPDGQPGHSLHTTAAASSLGTRR